MSKQMTNDEVSLMAGRYTYNGRETLEESYGIHFPDSRVTTELGTTRP
jgi:hypothetical protein